ncbi:hypothetical protein Ciccas_004141 [Cichlidogyrus casuarinus]|uniref:Uncharacterized protein n=1 Tax=Cichlidogyrus casuarinus TaxID=1844966 RepID=A0ABD2QCC7_9PLAT
MDNILLNADTFDPSQVMISLIHLKNLFSKPCASDVISLDDGGIRMRLFALLNKGNEVDFCFNSVDCSLSFSKVLVNVIGRLFKLEWTIAKWPDAAWSQLYEMNCWSTIKHCIKSASQFRIPRRMKQLSNVINDLYPTLSQKFLTLMQESDTRLSHSKLGICKVLTTAIMCSPQKTGSELLEKDKATWQSLLSMTISHIRANLSDDSSMTKNCAKMVYVLVTASSQQLFDPSALQILTCLIQLICEESQQLQSSTARIILSLIHKILDVRRHITPSAQSIHYPLSISQPVINSVIP